MAQHVAIPGVELLEELGRGAFSVVYRARRNGQEHALKLPLPERPEELLEIGKRFRREAVALARVRHPALPAVLEVGQAGNVPFIIMELARGRTLAERLVRGALAEAQVVDLGHKLAGALAAIHRSGLVHRDVKPKNIVFDAESGTVRLVDFGFAAAVRRRGGLATRAGTPAYMAPEMLGAQPARVDGRADLYSLGCVLCEALTGLVPDPPPNPDTLPASGELGRIILRLLARDPDDRFPSAEALVAALEELEGRKDQDREALHRPIVASLAPGPSLPLVGRERELGALRDAWNDARRSHGRVVLLEGSAGSGKTRLVEALVEAVAPEDRPVLVAACRQADPRPYAAVRQILRAHVQTLQRAAGGDRDAALAHLQQLAGDVAPLVPILAPELGGALEAAPPLPRFEDAAHVFAEGVTELLLKLLRDAGPVLVLVDDAHWLDPASRRVLARLADRAASAALLLIFAAREPGSAGAAPDLSAALPPGTKIIRLGALEPSQAAALIQSYLGDYPVESDDLAAIARLANGSPLATLEVVRAALEDNALEPAWGRWKLDRGALENMKLSGEAAEILARRLHHLEENVLEILRAAAVIGPWFEDDLLRAVTGLDDDVFQAALVEGRQAWLVETTGEGTHRFVHDSVRQALLRMLSPERRRTIHQRTAECLDALSRPGNVELTYTLASHYAAGHPDGPARRVFETNLAAGRLAFQTFDNERALSFLRTARDAAARANLELDLDIEWMTAEVELRTGALEQSIDRFRRIIASSADPAVRARALYRIAWIEMQLDADAAWHALDAAFQELGEPPPTDSLWGLLRSLFVWAWRELLPRRAVESTEERARLETVVVLHYWAARLAAETTRPLRMLQATFRSRDPAERLGPSDALIRSLLMVSWVLTALGLRKVGRRYLDRADEMARVTEDPAIIAHTLQNHMAIAAWAGDVPDALATGARCLGELGHWRELTEYCLTAHSHVQMETVRGRSRETWRWLELCIQKASQHERVPRALDYLELSARAALTELGREAEAGTILARLRTAMGRAPVRGAASVWPLGAEIQLLSEKGQVGPELEALVERIRQEGWDPRRDHLSVTVYFVHLAHARVHACLRASAEDLPGVLPHLRDALRELRRAARIPLLEAHARVIRGYEAFFSGRHRAALRHFNRAEALGTQEAAPWVLYAVHRGRAHLLERDGLGDAARVQAKLAEAIAEENGSAYRLRWIREEFGLRGARRSTSRSSRSDSSTSSRRCRSRSGAAALVRVAEASTDELTPERQSAAVIEEALEQLRADRGSLLLASAAGRARSASEVMQRLRLVTARSREGEDLEGQRPPPRTLLEKALEQGTVQLAEEAPGEVQGPGTSGGRAMIAAPVFIQGAPLGVLYLERDVRKGAFIEEDGQQLASSADQVPVVLELVRALLVRERTRDAAFAAEKTAAVGRIIGGVARSIDVTSTEILTSASSVLASGEGQLNEGLATIRGAVEQARELADQLMTLAGDPSAHPVPLQLNDILRRLEPILARVFGPAIELDLRLEPALHPVQADPRQIDLMITRLALQAAEGMPHGGHIRMETANVRLGKKTGAHGAASNAGPYAMLLVADTGAGLDSAARDRLFEPFTGGQRHAGLAAVHSAVIQNGGHIEVDSQPGLGTTFRIYLPRSRETLTATPSLELTPKTILVADNDPLSRHLTGRLLESRGYRPLLAESGREAVALADQHVGEIHAAVVEISLPDMNGIELVRRLVQRSLRLRVLFASSAAHGVVPPRDLPRDRVAFVQKPLTPRMLLDRLPKLLEGSEDEPQ